MGALTQEQVSVIEVLWSEGVFGHAYLYGRAASSSTCPTTWTHTPTHTVTRIWMSECKCAPMGMLWVPSEHRYKRTAIILGTFNWTQLAYSWPLQAERNRVRSPLFLIGQPRPLSPVCFLMSLICTHFRSLWPKLQTKWAVRTLTHTHMHTIELY